jgi:quercetin dioxygenase-like cupin family protein
MVGRLSLGSREASTFIMSDNPKNAPKGVTLLKGPTIVRHRDAARFRLRLGGYFKSSDTWKSYFDQDRFYYVLKGEIAVQDPQSGEIAVARAGEAVHWRGAKWHFGYNFTADETIVLDWYAPQERPPNVSELEFGATKPKFEGEKAGRFELLGKWPHALSEARAEAERRGGLITARRQDALHFIHGDRHPIMEALFVSTKELTAGAVDLMPSARSDDRTHPSDKVIFVTAGKLHVYLPQTYDWFELDEWDLLYLPADTPHQYWNHSGRPLSFAFMVVPRYA